MAEVNRGNDPLNWRDGVEGSLVYKNPAPARSTHCAWLDIEATHYSPKLARILEIAIIHERDGAFSWKVRVNDWDLRGASPESLKIVGFSRQEWADAPPLLSVMQDVARVLQNTAVVAFNGLRYDIPLLSMHMDQVGLGPRWHPKLAWDPYYTFRMLLPDMKKLNLDLVCERFGLEPEGTHRAMGGAQRLKKLCEILRTRIR